MNWLALFHQLMEKGFDGLEWAFIGDTCIPSMFPELQQAVVTLRLKYQHQHFNFGLFVDNYSIQLPHWIRLWIYQVEYVVVKSYGQFKYETYDTIAGPVKLLQAKPENSLEDASKQLDNLPKDLQFKYVVGLNTAAIVFRKVNASNPAVSYVCDTYRGEVYRSLQLREDLKVDFNSRQGSFHITAPDDNELLSLECGHTVRQKLNYFVGDCGFQGVYLENPIYDLPLEHPHSIFQKCREWQHWQVILEFVINSYYFFRAGFRLLSLIFGSNL